MPTKKAAVKALRQNKKNRIRNVKAIGQIKSLVKTTQKLALAKKTDEAMAKSTEAIKAIDRAAREHIIHANRAARLKSRLAAFLKKQK